MAYTTCTCTGRGSGLQERVRYIFVLDCKSVEEDYDEEPQFACHDRKNAGWAYRYTIVLKNISRFVVRFPGGALIFFVDTVISRASGGPLFSM